MAPECNDCGAATDWPINDMDAFRRAIADAVCRHVRLHSRRSSILASLCVGIERLELGMTDDLTIAARPRWPLDTRTSLRHHGKA